MIKIQTQEEIEEQINAFMEEVEASNKHTEEIMRKR